MHNIIAERAQTTSRQRSRTYWLWDLLSHALDICCRTGPPAQEKSSTFPTVTMIHFVKYGISTSNYMGVHRGSQKLAPLCVPPFSVRSNPTCGGKFSRVHHDFHTCRSAVIEDVHSNECPCRLHVVLVRCKLD